MRRIDLQSGFTGQRVEVYVNHHCVFCSEDVRTRLLFGFAKLIELKKMENNGQVSVVEVAVEGSPKFSMSVEQTPATDYLGLSVENGRVVHVFSEKPFGYA